MTHPFGDSAKGAARSLLGEALGFRDCSAATLDALVGGGDIRKLAKGECLVREGERFDVVGLVVAGALEVSLLRAEGHRHLISYLQPGDVVGLITMLDGMGHINDLRARVPSVLLLIAGNTMRSLLKTDMSLGRAVELQLAYRSRLLYERLAADPSMPLEARLARLLRTLSGLYGVRRPEGLLLKMKISQSDLADWLGVSRQRTNVALQQLKDEGLIQGGYSTIVITDTEGLNARGMC